MPFTKVEIDRAIKLNQFVPYFQPLVDLREGRIRGFEVLARWQHPTRGVIGPNEFIPFVESRCLMNSLSTSLIQQAFAAASVLPADIGLSINISPGQLHDRALPSLLHRLADAAEFDLKRLTVEITESALITDLDCAAFIAGDLKARGVRLSLDDFGTGYSSLLHLQSLPFDELKVDMSFVRSMVQSRQSRKITAAVISLGTSLGLETVGEGIEDRSQANLLLWQGCTLGQGWLYGRPVPAAELPAVLAQPRPARAVEPVSSSMLDASLAVEGHPIERLAQLRAIYDSAPVGLCFLDRELRYVNLNQRLADMNGSTVSALLGCKVADSIPPALYAQAERHLLRALEGEPSTGAEMLVPAARPGEPVSTRIASYQPVRDESGEVLGVCVSILDSFAFKQNKETLSEGADHYRHSLKLNPQSPWVTDAEGRNLTVNTQWQVLTGPTLPRAKDFGWLDAVHPDDRERTTETSQHSIDSGLPLDVEYRIRGTNGAWQSMRSRGEASRNSVGEITRWYGSVECIDSPRSVIKHRRQA